MSTNTVPRIHLADGRIFQRDMSPHSFVDFAVDVKCGLGGVVVHFVKVYQGVVPQAAEKVVNVGLPWKSGPSGPRKCLN